ncbi:hypothetical protein CIB84_009154 [Bambusicola thoracicus]|uniref:Uncharacterized protein n=1 Tax=Bambusicola thoracicus TaxID=9083 RepID=A0A2P4SSL7_BAMTH|nr:hypothetical protein CIB84_009154 [Bambusicola thoracicus]
MAIILDPEDTDRAREPAQGEQSPTASWGSRRRPQAVRGQRNVPAAAGRSACRPWQMESGGEGPRASSYTAASALSERAERQLGRRRRTMKVKLAFSDVTLCRLHARGHQ